MSYEYRPLVGENYRYNTNSEKPFKLSRSKIELFYKCSRCFFKEVKLGLRQPPMPSWAINSAVDALLKKESFFLNSLGLLINIFFFGLKHKLLLTM